MTAAEPTASRPYMPSYGLDPATSGDGLLPWSWAEERLAASRNYWVATTRPDGGPHLAPVWAVWLDGRLLFSTAEDSRKSRNLQANPAVTVSTEGAEEAVILEGVASLVAPADWAAFAAAYKAKYDWVIEAEPGFALAVTPARVFGFIEAADRFSKTATRWVFGRA